MQVSDPPSSDPDRQPNVSHSYPDIPRLRGSISSDLNVLDSINLLYPWLPTSHTCRPNEMMLEAKAALRREIATEWRTPIDYISHTVFDCEYWIDECTNKKTTTCLIEGQSRFLPCQFPYKINGNGNHYVLWYGSRIAVADEIINQDIIRFLEDMIGVDSNYQFAWYLNPKQTIPDIFHVQVFWVDET